ncbi:hypothetical protein BBP40_011772 [Aspergillus hancockii]|nr:hypothetical protein BBP40_011772 [Aspergillus hancockii]
MELNNAQPHKSPTAHEHTSSRWPTMIDGKRKAKKRIRNFTPEDRAAHRVFEKSRRDAFNDQLMELAKSIPATSTAKRLSKYTIVDESISYHRTQNRRCLDAIQGLRALIAERDELLNEVNALRTLIEPGDINLKVARPMSSQVTGFLQHELEFADSLKRTTDTRETSTESPGQTRTDSDNPGSSGAAPRPLMDMSHATASIGEAYRANYIAYCK